MSFLSRQFFLEKQDFESISMRLDVSRGQFFGTPDKFFTKCFTTVMAFADPQAKILNSTQPLTIKWMSEEHMRWKQNEPHHVR